MPPPLQPDQTRQGLFPLLCISCVDPISLLYTLRLVLSRHLLHSLLFSLALSLSLFYPSLHSFIFLLSALCNSRGFISLAYLVVDFLGLIFPISARQDYIGVPTGREHIKPPQPTIAHSPDDDVLSLTGNPPPLLPHPSTLSNSSLLFYSTLFFISNFLACL